MHERIESRTEKFRVRRVIAAVGVAACVAGCSGVRVVEPTPETVGVTAEVEGIPEIIARLEASRSMGNGKLLRFLADPDPAIRGRAAIAIGRIGTSTVDLAQRLRDDDESVRAAAVLGATLSGDDRFVPDFMRAAADPSPLVRARALVGLGRLRAARAIPSLVAGLRDPDPSVRIAAADACGLVGEAAVVEPLVAAFAKAEGRERYHIVNAIDRLHVQRRDVITERPVPRDPVLDAALGTTQSMLLRAATDAEPDVVIAALSALRRRDAVESPAPIYAALASPRHQIVVAAIAAVANQRNAQAVQAITDRLRHENPHVRIAAARSLDRLAEVVTVAQEGTRREAVVDELARAIELEAEPSVTAALIVPFGRIGGATEWRRLARFETAKDARLRAGVCRAAAAVGGETAKRVLHQLETDRDPRVRIAVVEGWNTVGGDASTRRIARALGDAVSGVRARAAEALRDRLDTSAVGALVTAYRDGQENPEDRTAEARLAILRALARLGGAQYATIFNEALTDPSSMVRAGTVEILGKLTGVEPELEFRAPEHGAARPGLAPGELVGKPVVTFYTTRGAVKIQLDPEIAPVHVDTFLAMVRNGFYDGKRFHRVVTNHVVQGGDPEGTGYGGLNFTLPDEPGGTPFERGSVGMAKLGRDTGSCQFFVCTVPRPHLNLDYTRFGRVIEGMDVVNRILPDDLITKAVW